MNFTSASGVSALKNLGILGRILACLLMISALIPNLGGAAGHVQADKLIESLSRKPTLTLAEEEQLAKAIFAKLRTSKDGDLAMFERCYKVVLDKCPNTTQAHEAAWRLTNLYTQAYDSPKYEEIVRILEPFLSRTKDSKVVSMKKYPDELLKFSPLRSLHQAYEALKRFDKIVAYYDQASVPESNLSLYDVYDYAAALDKTGRAKDAVLWYEKFLKKSQGKDDVDFMREIVEDRLKEIKKGG